MLFEPGKTNAFARHSVAAVVVHVREMAVQPRALIEPTRDFSRTAKLSPRLIPCASGPKIEATGRRLRGSEHSASDPGWAEIASGVSRPGSGAPFECDNTCTFSIAVDTGPALVGGYVSRRTFLPGSL